MAWPRWLALLALALAAAGCNMGGNRGPERGGGGLELNPIADSSPLPPERPADDVLQPLLDTLIADRWWGLYAGTTRIGKYHLVGKKITTAEGEGIALTAEAVLETPPPVLRLQWEARFARNGMPLSVTERAQEESELGTPSRSTTYEISGGQVRRVEVDGGSAARETLYPIPADAAFLLRGIEGCEMFMIAASVAPLVGRSYEYAVPRPAGAQPVLVSVEDREPVKVRGESFDCLRLKLEQGPVARRVWMTDERRVMKWTEIGADGKEGITALAGSPEEAESDLADSGDMPGPEEALLAFVKAIANPTTEVLDLLCDYDALYGNFVRGGRAKVSRSGFDSWFRNRVLNDPNLKMSVRSIELLRPLLRTVVRGPVATVAFTDAKSGSDFFRFTFQLTEHGWLVVNVEP